MKLLLQILWGKQSKWQFLFASFGFLVGMVITLLSVQVYSDIRQYVAGAVSESNKSYLTINRLVTLANTFDKSNSFFSPEQVDSLQMQPFIDTVIPFKANTFDIEMDLGEQFDIGVPLSIPVEAVPDAYIDTVPPEFVWDSTKDFIPVLMWSEIMRIYNTGALATQQNLPQIPDLMVQMYNFKVIVRGKGQEKVYNARVVGFTDRIASILVPEGFMDYANGKYGKAKMKPPAKLLLEVPDPGDQRLADYLKSHFFEANKEQLRVKNTAQILQTVVAVTGSIGLLFVLLSFIIFMVNFQLIISRAKQEIDILLDLGYKRGQLARLLWIQFAVVIVLVVGASYLISIYGTGVMHRSAIAQQIALNVNLETSGLLPIIAVLSIAVTLLINLISLRATLRN